MLIYSRMFEGRRKAEAFLDLFFGKKENPFFVKTDREFLVDEEIDKLFIEKRRELAEKGYDVAAAAEITRWASAWLSGFLGTMLGPDVEEDSVRKSALALLPRALAMGEKWHKVRPKKKESPLRVSEIVAAKKFGQLCAIFEKQNVPIELTEELLEWLEGL